MDRVENSTMKGMPDVEGHHRGRQQFWIELKSSERPVRSNTPVRFKVRDREAQVEWLTRRCSVGGLAWLLLQVGSGAQRRIYLIAGTHAPEVYNGVPERRLQELDDLDQLKPKPVDVIRRASRAP